MVEQVRMNAEDDAEAGVYPALRSHIGTHDTPPEPGNVSFFPAAAQGPDGVPVRDFKSAIDLIKEASEAIRFAEERADELEQQLHQVSTRSMEQVKALELQIAALERRLTKSEERARAAEVRANEAETWLSRLHDTVITSFRRPVHSADGDA